MSYSYTPALPLSGYAGWKVLTRTMDRQMEAYSASTQVQTNEDYFREKIGSVTSAKDLVSDYRLLSVALGAFGLSDDVDKKYLVQKVLESDTSDSSSLANKLGNHAYAALAEAFGFGDGDTPQTQSEGFADKILAQYETEGFQSAVSDENESLGIALMSNNSLPNLAASSSSENTKWYQIIASDTLSTFMQGALGLPEDMGSLDVDQQVTLYKQKAKEVFGSDDLADLVDSTTLDKMTENYLIRAQISDSSSTGTSAALQILQSGSSSTISGSSILSLLL